MDDMKSLNGNMRNYYMKKQVEEDKRKETRKEYQRQQQDVSYTKTSSDNITFNRKHYASMADALKKVNPNKW